MYYIYASPTYYLCEDGKGGLTWSDDTTFAATYENKDAADYIASYYGAKAVEVPETKEQS